MTKTSVLSIQDPRSIPKALDILSNHGTVAFPTDTIYGIAADAFSAEGIKRLYWVKGRSPEKALPVLIGEIKQLCRLVSNFSDYAQKITAAFWPGPLTLVLPKGPAVPSELSPYPTIGVRMPDLQFTLDLLQRTGPLATTSANLSGGKNPLSAGDVLEQLDGRVDLVLDGGPTSGLSASTVVDASTPHLKILREGPITLQELIHVLEQDDHAHPNQPF
jgi:L-threonylcarbamoyladenylate synthase